MLKGTLQSAGLFSGCNENVGKLGENKKTEKIFSRQKEFMLEIKWKLNELNSQFLELFVTLIINSRASIVLKQLDD